MSYKNIEINYYPVSTPKGTILFWPCWLGDFKSKFYQIPIDTILKMEYSLILYNPPGHGQSEEIFSPKESIFYINEFIKKEKINNVPLWGVSHSGGCNCLLKTAAELKLFQKLFLFSPVLDSRRSLHFMYENNSISEFVRAFKGEENENFLHLDVFRDSRWLDQSFWENMNYSERLDYSIVNRSGMKFQSIAKLLQNILFPGEEAWEELRMFQSITEVFIADHDTWFPRNELITKLNDMLIPYTLLPKGTDHFLVNHWDTNWQVILEKISLL